MPESRHVCLQGSIPYVPYLRAPYYVWVGHVPQLATVLAENKVEAPPMFPPTFLYTQSWEDPRPDMEVSLLPHAPLSVVYHAEGAEESSQAQGMPAVTVAHPELPCPRRPSCPFVQAVVCLLARPLALTLSLPLCSSLHSQIAEMRLSAKASLILSMRPLLLMTAGPEDQKGRHSTDADQRWLQCPQPSATRCRQCCQRGLQPCPVGTPGAQSHRHKVCHQIPALSPRRLPIQRAEGLHCTYHQS